MIDLRHPCAGALVGCLLVASACDGAGAPITAPVTDQRGASQVGRVQDQPPPALPVVTPSGARVRRRGVEPIATAAPATGLGAAAADAPVGTTDEAPGVDLGAALRSSFGTPTDCISPETRATLRGTLRLTVSVRVTPSGRVTSASVTGRSLSAADLACMRARAESLQLPGPIEGAPRSVMTTVEFEAAGTAPTTTAAEGPPEPGFAPGAVRPGSTLAPGGTETARPRGFVAPSSTLPAIAE